MREEMGEIYVLSQKKKGGGALASGGRLGEVAQILARERGGLTKRAAGEKWRSKDARRNAE